MERVSIRTYKIVLKRNFVRHNKASEKKRWYEVRRKLNKYIRVARKVANFAIIHRKSKLTSKTVKNFGTLPSAIANQLIRKYKNDKKCKKATHVNLIVPSQHTGKYPSITHEDGVLNIKVLDLKLKWKCPVDYDHICQVVVTKKVAFVTISIILPDGLPEEYKLNKFLGVDTNMKPALFATADVYGQYATFIGKGMMQRRLMSRAIRTRYQRQLRYKRVRQMGDREHRYMNTANHQVTRQVIELAKSHNLNVAIENLSGIRKQSVRKSFRYFLNSWQFYALRVMMEYKAADIGMSVAVIDPKYTSQRCPECLQNTKCRGKNYVCQYCGHTAHRDTNAGMNIAAKGNLTLVQE